MFRLLLTIWVPLIFVQIDVAVGVNFDAVVTESAGVLVNSAESKRYRASAKTVDHPKTRDMLGIGIEMKGISNCPRSFRRIAKAGNLSVGCHFAFGDFFDLFVNRIVKTHNVVLCENGVYMCKTLIKTPLLVK